MKLSPFVPRALFLVLSFGIVDQVAAETQSSARRVRLLVPQDESSLLDFLRTRGAEFEELREDRVFGSTELVPNRRRGDEVASMPIAVPAGTVVATMTKPGAKRIFASSTNENGEALELVTLRSLPRLKPHVRVRTIRHRDARVAVAADGEKKHLKYEVCYGSSSRPNLSGAPLRVPGWTPDGKEYLEERDGRLVRVDPKTGSDRPALDAKKLASSLSSLAVIDDKTAEAWSKRTSFHLDPRSVGALFDYEHDLYYARLDGTSAARLTSTPEREELADFSPDGAFVAFVRDNDLWVVDVATQTERALTTGGTETLRNGKADWVYFEEVFDRDWNAFWWSPDSRHIAFLRTDSSHVPKFTIVDDLPAKQNIETARYPKPGDPNPIVELGIVSVAGGPVHWTDLSDYDAENFLVTGVGFLPDGESAYFYGQNRIQTWLDFSTVPVKGGRPARLFRETTKAWVAIPPAPRFLRDGSFLWMSERTGWQHIYHLEKDGKLRRAVTSGEWEARRLRAVDEDGGWVYVSGTKDSPIAENLYRVRLDASKIERLTPEDGHHSVLVAPKTFAFIDGWSNRHQPIRVELRASDGALVRTLDTNPVEDLDRFRVRRFEPFEIAARDGYSLPAMLLKPPGFDPNRKYPLWLQTYAGPHAPTVRGQWSRADGRLWDQMLAAEGVVVLRCDPRSATGRGAVSAWTAYRQLGVKELEDITDIVESMKKRRWVDADRIGMSGYSYGGFMTAYAMTHSKLFAAGFSGAPVTDWRDYDSIYTERYMSTPQDNPDGYAKTSVVSAAANLHGRLLLVHGTMDDNVHIQNSLRLIRALQDANKQFDFMIYPGDRHAIWAGHLRRMRFEFIRKHLRPETPEPSSRGERGSIEF